MSLVIIHVILMFSECLQSAVDDVDLANTAEF